MHNIIRGEEAWKRLPEINHKITAEQWPWLTPDAERFIDKLRKAKKNGNLYRIVHSIHVRIAQAHGTLPEMMIAEDTWPHRTQIMFVWNERFRQEMRQRGVRYWLPTILQFKVEDFHMPPEEEPELPESVFPPVESVPLDAEKMPPLPEGEQA